MTSLLLSLLVAILVVRPSGLLGRSTAGRA